MKPTNRQKNDQKENVSLTARRRLSEGGLILLTAIALYLLLALATYHSSDPGWSSSGTGGFVANAGGRGAGLPIIFVFVWLYCLSFSFYVGFSAWGVFRGEFIYLNLNIKCTLRLLVLS